MEKVAKNRRRNYFIDRGFQSKFIVKFCALVILASILIGTLIYFFNRQTITVALENLKVVAMTTSDFIFPAMFGIIIVVTLLIGVITIAVTLLTSHKIAGPLYRLKAELEKMRGGDFSSDIHIRTKDQLQKLASEFNDMRVGLKGSITTIKDDWNAVKTRLRDVRQGLSEEDKKSISNSIEKIDTELSRFKTD